MVTFSIEGRPPRKYGYKSGWSKEEAVHIIKLRENALAARSVQGLNTYYQCPVTLDITVQAPNITDRKSAHNYIGDLDAFISGICEALQAAPTSAPLNLAFRNIPSINPQLPILFEDDSLVISIKARKIKANESSYTVSVKPYEPDT